MSVYNETKWLAMPLDPDGTPDFPKDIKIIRTLEGINLVMLGDLTETEQQQIRDAGWVLGPNAEVILT